MERFFRNPQTIRQKRQGPLGVYIDDFAQLLSDQGYTRECARRRLRLVAEFSHWLWVPPLDCEGYYSHQRKAISQIESAASAYRPWLCYLLEGLSRIAISEWGNGCTD